jgi:NAD(P)-dependent dehydrogenase (short-subunit alcohol dehydrogenase family)
MRSLALVTGASTGIGRACAIHLAGLGFHVLAGVRDPADAPDGLDPLRLDVTSESDVAAAAERVGAELGVLVNNAGIAINGPVEVVPLDQWRRIVEVNLLGQVAVTRALLPAILRARGRVVNMSSIGGRVANPLFGPYSATKFALEAVSDALRREVAAHGVRVVSIEPGGIATPIWDKGLEEGRRIRPTCPRTRRAARAPATWSGATRRSRPWRPGCFRTASSIPSSPAPSVEIECGLLAVASSCERRSNAAYSQSQAPASGDRMRLTRSRKLLRAP